MFNHNRGLWGYTGDGADGEPLTIQSTGMGGPSAAIVVEELCELGRGARVRVGTCGALDARRSALGELVAATEVIAADGASRALGAGERVAADARADRALAGGADRAGTVVSTDLFYDPRADARAGGRADGALAVDMETAAVLDGRAPARHPRGRACSPSARARTARAPRRRGARRGRGPRRSGARALGAR